MKSMSLAVVLVAACAARAQVFSVLPEGPALQAPWAVEGPRPVRGAVVGVDVARFEGLLAAAPAQRPGEPLRAYGLRLALPDPAGAMIECAVAESPVMEAELAARFPDIRTYIVQSMDGVAAGRLEVSPRGVTAMLRTAGMDATRSAWMIDPWRSGDAAHVVSYWLRDLPGGGDWGCHTAEGVHGFGVHEEGDPAAGGPGPQVLRTVQLAMACTGEYGVHQSTIQGHEPNAADPLAAIVTVVARTNVVYEADMGVHFDLIANNDLIVYFNPATDPYPDTCDGADGGNCSSPLLSANISNLSSVIGNANFDVGHLVTRVSGGVAFLSSVCGPFKAGGVSGIPRGGDVDPLSALVVIHELGHQFGANHTFSGTRGRCGGNVSLSTAWEAGSGSSPMAYPGGCPVGDEAPSDNIVLFADPFFHHGSINEMRGFLTAPLPCITRSDSGNAAPVITSVTPDTLIPPSTPFTLSAAASDENGDTLSFSWEQFDNNVARPLSGEGATDNGAGALFRVFPPVTSPSRTFPQMSDVLAGAATPGERLPTAPGATRRFRVIVRDNRPGVGAATISQLVHLMIAPKASAFAVLSPGEDDILSAGAHSVQWSTGNTQDAPISCPSVTITLSTDDGATFEHDLGSYPNNGSATVTLPPVDAAARLRIDADGEIFFAVSRPFTLKGACAGDFNTDGAVTSQDFFDFLAAFFQATPRADFNADGVVNSQDFFDFLEAFFAGC